MATDLIAQLGYLGIGVKDIGAWKEFATDILGLSVAEELDDGTLYLRQDEYHHRFVIEPTGEDDVKYAGWMVATLNALEEVQARVEAEGIEVEEASPEECAYRKVAKMITFKDPDGVRLEVFYGLDVVVNVPFHSPRTITGFHAGALGLGHILLAVNDVDVTERFYRDVLGFRVSDTSITGQGTGAERKMTFLHVNPRHHSLAMGVIPEPRHLNHWMMQMNTLDDVGYSYDLAKKKGLRFRNHLGRHGNDMMVSFYVFSPSGFAVELGWGGLEIDDETWVVKKNDAGYMWGGEPGTVQEQQTATQPTGVGTR